VLDLVGVASGCWDEAGALDHGDAGQAGPIMALLQPVDIVGDGDVAGLDAPVIAIGGLMVGAGGVFEIIGFLLVGEQFDIVAQRALVTLQGEDVVGLLVHDLLVMAR